MSRFLATAHVTLPPERRRARDARFCAVTFSPSGAPARVHIYDSAARFDTLSIYQVAKHLFADRADVLRLLFPSDAIQTSIRALEPAETLELAAPAPAPISEKMALLELFNAFHSSLPPARVPYYYRRLPLGEDVDHVVLE